MLISLMRVAPHMSIQRVKYGAIISFSYRQAALQKFQTVNIIMKKKGTLQMLRSLMRVASHISIQRVKYGAIISSSYRQAALQKFQTVNIIMKKKGMILSNRFSLCRKGSHQSTNHIPRM